MVSKAIIMWGLVIGFLALITFLKPMLYLFAGIGAFFLAKILTSISEELPF